MLRVFRNIPTISSPMKGATPFRSRLAGTSYCCKRVAVENTAQKTACNLPYLASCVRMGRSIVAHLSAVSAVQLHRRMRKVFVCYFTSRGHDNAHVLEALVSAGKSKRIAGKRFL